MIGYPHSGSGEADALLSFNLDTDDKVASATVIPPEDPKVNGHDGTLLR